MIRTPTFPAQEPAIKGQLGQAWLMDLKALVKRPDEDATLRLWLVHAPYAHPMWHSYAVGLIHLRPMPGVGPAKVNLPGAQHEVMVFALNPDHDYAIDQLPRYLTPANFIGQFIQPDDEAAIKYVEETVQMVCHGTLNPDTDYTQWWIRRFSASNIKGNPAEAGQTVITIGDTAIVVPPVKAPND